MWRLRRAEVEFEERLKRKSREESSSCQGEQSNRRTFVKRCTSVNENVASSSSSSSQSRNKRWQSDDNDEKGLGDVEIETFLQSRVKRGRGYVGPKMDEPFPCLPVNELSRTSDRGDPKLVLKPEKSPLLRHESVTSEEEEAHVRSHRKRKEDKQKLSTKHKSKEKKRDSKKRREEKKRKHGRD